MNWSNGPIKGATLTLSERDGGLLISFVATFVTIVGAQLWRVISFLIHQVRSTNGPRDGLHHQQQAIFRNASTPGGAAWSFLLQTWYWRGRASHSALRTLPWTIFGILYLILFGVLATFSSQVSKAAGSARLIHGDNCGYWRLDEDLASDSSETTTAYQQRMTNETIVTGTYARACYGGSADKISCGTYPVPALDYISERNASCPFASGTCVHGDSAAFKLATKALNSHHQLGINAPSSRRIDIHKELTCAPLRQIREAINGSAGETDAGTEGHIFIRYLYGPVASSNFTYQYNTQAMYTRSPYTVNTVQALAPHTENEDGWRPIENLATTDADVTIVFIAPNGIRFQTPVDDPVFGAHYEIPLSGGGSYYEADEYNVAIGCTERYHICDPNSNKCSDSVGIRQLSDITLSQLDLNDFQQSLVSRVQMALLSTGLYSQVVMRLAATLRAMDTAAGLDQQPLPANQWEIEVSGWFESGLARLQYLTQEYATGPSFVPRGSHVWSPGKDDGDIYQLAMCYSQMINDTGGTTSFSILGLVVVFVFGGLIIFTSLVLDTVVGWLQTLLKKGSAKKLAWLLDDKLQLQRFVLETAGLGTWSAGGSFPVTVNEEKFGRFASGSESAGTLDPSLVARHSFHPMSSMATPGMAFPPPPSGRDGPDTVPNINGHKDSDVFVRELRE